MRPERTVIEAHAPRMHVAHSPARLADGKVYRYAYLRYEVWDDGKHRYQPKPLAALGRSDRIDPDRLESLEGFLKEWLRKDSSLPFDALRERFKEAEPALQILCSRDFGLRWILEQAWKELGYSDAVAELAKCHRYEFSVEIAVFAMVLVQLVAPQSKRGAAEWKDIDLFFPEGEHLSERHLYLAQDVLEEGYELVEQTLKERLESLGASTELLSHDTTTQGFYIRYDDEERAALEDERQAAGEVLRPAVINDPPLRMRGHSKNKRQDLPQIVLETVAGEHGLVIHHEIHSGSTNDNSLTPDTLEYLQRLGYRDVVWTGDAGTNSVANRRALREANYELVLGEGVSRTKVAEVVLATAGRYRPHPDKPELSYKCVITEATDERRGKKRPGPQRLYVIRKNSKEEHHALRLIAAHLKKVEAILAKGTPDKREALLHHRAYRRYVKRAACADKKKRLAGAVVLDREEIERRRFLAGKSVIARDDCTADPIETDQIYRSLFDVERIFRRLKSTIRLGPIRHRRADRIRSHVMIAVMAHNLGRWLERKTGETLERLQRLFHNLRVQQVRVGENTYWQCVELEEEQKEAIRKLGYDLPPARFTASVLDEDL